MRPDPNERGAVRLGRSEFSLRLDVPSRRANRTNRTREVMTIIYMDTAQSYRAEQRQPEAGLGNLDPRGSTSAR